MRKITDYIFDALCIILAAFLIFAVTHKMYGESHRNCAWCGNPITETADYVTCTDGRNWHAECYLVYVKEGNDGQN